VRRLLGLLAPRRPLVVVIDDLHWAEATLLDMVEQVADWSRDAGILLICIARLELLEVRPQWAGGKLNTTSLLLEALGEADCGRLVDSLVGEVSSGPGGRLRAVVVQTAEGNPLFVEELVNILVDDRVLVGQNGRWVLKEDALALRARMPPTISALLAARLDHLAEQERAVIERASVIGKTFDQKAVASLCSASARPAVAANLRSLVRKQLLRPDSSANGAGEEVFSFRHLLIRDAAYAALPKMERAELHQRFADWLEHEHLAAGRLAESHEILGYHLEQACRYQAELGGRSADEALARRAADHLVAASAQAYSRDDLRAMAKLLCRALALLPQADPQRVERLVDLGEVLTATGQLEQAGRVPESLGRFHSASDRMAASSQLWGL
jgi:predicted ATPase